VSGGVAGVQERTHLSTDYQTDKQIHPSVKFTIKISTKVSPTKPADAKIKKLNITPGYTSWLQRKTTEIGTVTCSIYLPDYVSEFLKLIWKGWCPYSWC
jgi:hypothetical protein